MFTSRIRYISRSAAAVAIQNSTITAVVIIKLNFEKSSSLSRLKFYAHTALQPTNALIRTIILLTGVCDSTVMYTLALIRIPAASSA